MRANYDSLYNIAALWLALFLIPFFGFSNQVLASPLHKASKEGNIEKVHSIIASGTNINALDQGVFQYTALHYAARAGHTDILKLLLDNGAKVNARALAQGTVGGKRKTWRSGTPLKEASAEGHIEVVKILLENGADVNIPDHLGTTPLISAAIGGHNEIVKLLIEHGAKTKIKSELLGTAEQAATSRGHSDVVTILNNAPEINKQPVAKPGFFSGFGHGLSSPLRTFGLLAVCRP